MLDTVHLSSYDWAFKCLVLYHFRQIKDIFINLVLKSSDFKIFNVDSIQNSPGSISVNLFMCIMHVIHEEIAI